MWCFRRLKRNNRYTERLCYPFTYNRATKHAVFVAQKRPGCSPTACLVIGPSMSTKEADGSKADVECPTCGEEFPDTPRVGIHHSAEHDETLKEYRGRQGDIPCPWDGCDRAFDSDVALKSHHFGAHNVRMGSVLIPCANCQKPKRVKKCRAGMHDRHFCNDSCQAEWRTENYVGENNPLWSRIEVECAACEDTKYVRPCLFRDRERFFCNVGCMGDYYETVTGPDHPCWEGGDFLYGEGWDEAKRERVRENYNRECQGCGVAEAEYIQQSGNRLSVHHITPARAFDDPEERNAESNLIPLCQPCHVGKWEGIPLRPQLAD